MNEKPEPIKVTPQPSPGRVSGEAMRQLQLCANKGYCLNSESATEILRALSAPGPVSAEAMEWLTWTASQNLASLSRVQRLAGEILRALHSSAETPGKDHTREELS